MTAPVVTAPAVDCSKLIPDQLRSHVKSAPIPQGHLTLGPVEKFADAQTGQLDLANTRGDVAISIADECAKANADIAKKLQHHWWQVF